MLKNRPKHSSESDDEEEAEQYPDDFESYDSEESISLYDPNNESIELLVIKNTLISDSIPKKHHSDPIKSFPFDFQKELEAYIEGDSIHLQRKPKPITTQNSLDFSLSKLMETEDPNLYNWYFRTPTVKKISSESQRSVPLRYLHSKRDVSPSTEFSYSATKNLRNTPIFTKKRLFEKHLIFTAPAKLPLEISAVSWAVANYTTGQLLCGRNFNKKREIASLTKIMTSYVVCDLLKRMNICPSSTFLQVSKQASLYQGTSAELQEGDVLSIADMLHGLLLPSGNDAAFCLAEHFGVYLFYERFGEKNNKKPQKFLLPKKGCMGYFIEEMNRIAKKLKLKNTCFANVHGLPNEYNKSTAADLCRLGFLAMREELIAGIVKKKRVEIKVRNELMGTERLVMWKNTNKMLEIEGFVGLKTGVTITAGACLASVYLKGSEMLVIVVLGCDSKEERFDDTSKILEWVKGKIKRV